jgi:hypothetical protein
MELLLEDINNTHAFLVDKCHVIEGRKESIHKSIMAIDHTKHLSLPRLEITTPTRYKMKINAVSGEREALSPDSNIEKDALQDFAIHLEELQELRFFTTVNMEAVRKIVKKFKKQTELPFPEEELRSHEFYSMNEKLDKLCEYTEGLYRTMRLKCPGCDGNIKEIRGVLQSKSMSEKKNRLHMENKKNISVPWRQHLYERVLNAHSIFHPSSLLRGTLVVSIPRLFFRQEH